MGISQLLTTYYEELSYTEKQVAHYIMEHIDEAAHVNIIELANKSLCSKSTILRLCKKLKFKGYTEMQAFLKFHQLTEEQEAHQLPYESVIQERMESLIKHYNDQDWRLFYQTLHQADKVYIMSTGMREYHLALELQRLLLQSNKFVQHIMGHVSHSVFQSMIESINSTDLLIVISHSGEGATLHDMMLVPLLHEYPLMSITSSYDNWLARHSHYSLVTGNDLQSGLPFKSNVLPFLAIELLISGYCQYRQEYERER
ncbi:MurR/RpiR family transcriptional regulator [Abiotrophia defectiva]|uniref:MurR/RpiR family transcriptional regulator n=1 Tax=Abiotrophia defectiva TaxID=46125 RepID=UPI0028D39C14|nr:MurR/RpiR family transcriptional regulator [Abiotrophia defectiva]